MIVAYVVDESGPDLKPAKAGLAPMGSVTVQHVIALAKERIANGESPADVQLLALRLTGLYLMEWPEPAEGMRRTEAWVVAAPDATASEKQALLDTLPTNRWVVGDRVAFGWEFEAIPADPTPETLGLPQIQAVIDAMGAARDAQMLEDFTRAFVREHGEMYGNVDHLKALILANPTSPLVVAARNAGVLP